MGSNADDTIVDRTRLRGIVQNAHDGSRITCLTRMRTISDDRRTHSQRGPHLIIEVVLWKIECESEEWEQLFPKLDRGMAITNLAKSS